jgi:hypothetical protein
VGNREMASMCFCHLVAEEQHVGLALGESSGCGASAAL